MNVIVILPIMTAKMLVILNDLGLAIGLLFIELSELGKRIFKLEPSHQYDSFLRLL
jgi:hypothetical protein